MWKCNKCGEYRYQTAKDCHCKEFKIIDEDGELHLVQEMTKEGAALKYAEESNVEGDYYLMDEVVEITVNGTPFSISAEPDVHYSANQIEGD